MTKSSALAAAIGTAAIVLNVFRANGQCTNATVVSASYCEGQRAEISLSDTDPTKVYHWYRDGDFASLGYGNGDKGRYFVSPNDITGVNSIDYYYSIEKPEIIGPASTIPLTGGTDAPLTSADYEMTFDAQTDFKLNSVTVYSKVDYADPSKVWGFSVRIATAAQLADPAQGQFGPWMSYKFTTNAMEKIVVPVNLDIKAGTGYTIQIKSGNAVLNLAATNNMNWYTTTSYNSTPYLNSPAQITINPITKSIYSSPRIPLIEDWNITVACPRVRVTATKRTTGCCTPAGSNFQINSPVAIVRDSDLPITLTVTGADAKLTSYYTWLDEGKNPIAGGEGIGKTTLSITKAGTYYVRIVEDPAFKNSFSCYKENSKLVQKRILFATIDKKNLCLGESATLIATGATADITWTPTSGVSPSTGKVVRATPISVGKQVYTVSATVPVGNIVVDGDFDESTITSPKFETKYNLIAEIPNGNPNPNNHASIGTRASAAWGGSTAKFCDDTVGFYSADRGRFLYADAASSGGVVPSDWGLNNYIWQQSNLPVFPNTTYEFRFLVTDWGVESLTDPLKTSDVQMFVNGQPLLGTPLQINKRCRWTEVKATWNSGNNTSAKLTISDVNAQNIGGEYAIDDISFGAPGTQTDTVSVNVTDCSGITAQKNGVCQGDSIQIEAKTNGLFMGWTRLDGAPLGTEETNNSKSLITWVHPKATTKYVATASFQLGNLLTNGDFEAGNVGFTSDYTSPLTNGQAHYSVDTDPFITTNGASWTYSKKDHTSGKGKMFLSDGGNNVSQSVFRATVNVETGKVYAVSAWLANIHSEFLKAIPDTSGTKTTNLAFFIDGQLNNAIKLPLDTVWHQYYATWTSTKTGPVTIEIKNRETAPSGNDFALDDMVFAPLSPEQKKDTVEVPACITCNQPKVTVSLPTAKDTAICVGKPMTLRGKFVNGPNATFDKLYYVWYKKGQTPIAARYKVVPADNTIPDSSIAAVTTASAGTYILRVQDGIDPSNSSCYGEDTVKVRINPLTTIATQPATPTSLCEGQNLNLTVVAAGTGPFTYQWKKNSTDSVGATSSSLSVASVVPSNAGTYSVVVMGVCGSASSTDAVVTIMTKPKITVQPVSTGGCIGSSTSLSVTATGTPTLHYQWKKGGNVGTDSPTLNFTSLVAGDAGDYTVEVSNTCATAISNIAKVAITLNETPSVTLITDSVLVCGNGTSIVTLTASGTGGGNNPLYTFKVGTNVIGVANQPFFSHIYTVPANTSISAENLSFTVEMTSNSTCLAPGASATVTSLPKTLDVDAQVTSANIIETKQTICTDGMALTADAIPTGYHGIWRKYQGSTGSGAIGSTSGIVSGILAGDAPRFEYLVESPLRKCPSKSDTVSIVRAGTLTTPNAGVVQAICSNATSVTLTGNAHQTNETATWAKANSTDPIALTQSGDNATLSGFVAGEYKLIYTLTNGICPALSDTAIVTIDQFVQATLDNTVPNPRSTCATSITLPGSIAPYVATSTGTWSIKTGSPNTATITNPSDSVSTLTNLPSGGTVVLEWEAKNGVCTSPKVEFTVKQVGSLTTPTIAINGGVYLNKDVTDKTADTLCVNALYTLTGSTPNTIKGETGAWTVVDAGTTGITGITGSNASQSVAPTSVGTAILRWTISPDAAVPGCTPEDADVTLVVHDVPQGGVITGNDFLCEGTDTVYTLNPASTSTLPVTYSWNVGPAPQGAALQGNPIGITADYLFTSDATGSITQGILTAAPTNRCGTNANAIANKVVGIRLAPRSFVSAPNDTINGPSAFCATSTGVKYKLDYLQPNTDDNGYVWYWNNQKVTPETDTSAIILKDWLTNASSTVTVKVELTNRCSAVKPANILTPFRDKQVKIVAPDALAVSLISDKTKFCEPDDKVLFTAKAISQLPGVTGTYTFYLNDTTVAPLPTSVPPSQYEFAKGVLKDMDNIYVKFKADDGQCLTVDHATAVVKVDGYRYPDSTLVFADTLICDYETTSLKLIPTDKNRSKITWYRSTTILGDTRSEITLGDPSESGTYRVEVTGNVCIHVSKSDSVNIKIYDTPDPVFAPNPLLIFYDQNSAGVPMPLVITGTNDSIRTVSYFPSTWLSKTDTLHPLIKTGSEEGQFVYVVKLSTGTPDGHPDPTRCSNEGNITVINTLPLLIPNAFSPNGDGKNERWEIDGLGKYPNTKVKVFNRWGNAMFTDNNGYRVPWDGTHHGAQLASGTYYYVIELEGSPDNTDNVRTGSLTIVR